MNSGKRSSPLRRIRRAQEMTQSELAGLVDCGISTISNIERGLTQPSWELAVKIGEAFDVDPRKLFPLPSRSQQPSAAQGAHA
jgi:DNA-binding XRE family transcriptional regulator